MKLIQHQPTKPSNIQPTHPGFHTQINHLGNAAAAQSAQAAPRSTPLQGERPSSPTEVMEDQETVEALKHPRV